MTDNQSSLARLQAIVSKKYKIEPERVTPEATFESLGLDSLDLIELLFEVEDEFNIRVPQDGSSALRLAKVQDVVESIDQLVQGGTAPAAGQPS